MIDANAVKAIEQILASGHDVQIKSKADGIVIIELEQKIKHKLQKKIVKSQEMQ